MIWTDTAGQVCDPVHTASHKYTAHPYADFKNFRLGIPYKHFLDEIDETTNRLPLTTIQEIRSAVLAAVDKMGRLGAHLIHHADILTTAKENREFRQAGDTQMSIEFKGDIGKYLTERKDLSINTLEDIVEFNRYHKVSHSLPDDY